MIRPSLSVRKTGEDDARLLFDWVNSVDSLAGKAETSAPINWETHVEWLLRRLSDPDTHMFIAEVDGRPVGQVRLQRKAEAFEIDVFIVSDERRRGYAAQALTKTLQETFDRATVVDAVVKEGNRASEALFKSLGFRQIDRSDGLRRFQIVV